MVASDDALLECFVGMPCKSISCRLNGLKGSVPIWQTYQWSWFDRQRSVKYLPVRTGASNELNWDIPMGSFRRPSVLIVDSDTESLFALAQMVNSLKIGNAKFQLLTAVSAQRAMNLANHVTIDLVISDIQLLDMPGEDLIDTIRGLTGCFQLPAIVLNRNQQVDVIRRVNDRGAAFHLRKPIDRKSFSELTRISLLSTKFGKAPDSPVLAASSQSGHNHFPVLDSQRVGLLGRNESSVFG
ncbi:response regulator [bacterium]|nr:response regulator [bacterium]